MILAKSGQSAPGRKSVVLSSLANFRNFQRQLQRRGRYPRGAWGGREGPGDETCRPNRFSRQGAYVCAKSSLGTSE